MREGYSPSLLFGACDCATITSSRISRVCSISRSCGCASTTCCCCSRCRLTRCAIVVVPCLNSRQIGCDSACSRARVRSASLSHRRRLSVFAEAAGVHGGRCWGDTRICHVKERAAALGAFWEFIEWYDLEVGPWLHCGLKGREGKGEEEQCP